MIDTKTAGGIGGGLILAFALAFIFFPSSAYREPSLLLINQTQFAGNGNSTFQNTNIPCTYLIFFATSTLIDSKNCSTGKIDYSGTNASVVIQTTINHITNGGVIYVRNGTYSLTSVINFNKTSIIMQGQGDASFGLVGTTKLMLAGGVNTNGTIVTVSQPNTQIRDLWIEGNKGGNTHGVTSTCLFFGSNTFDSTLQDVVVNGCAYRGVVVQNAGGLYFKADHISNIGISGSGAGIGLEIRGTGGTGITGASYENYYDSIFVDGITNNQALYVHGRVFANIFQTSEFDDALNDGVLVQSDSGGIPQNNIFTSIITAQLTGSSGTNGIRISGGQYNTFNTCVVRYEGQFTTNTYDGIKVEGTSFSNATNNLFSGCIITTLNSKPMKYGIEESNVGQDFNSYTHIQLNGTFGTGKVKTFGIHDLTSNIVGYNPVTASSVTAGASVWTYTNSDGYMENMVLSTVNGATNIVCNTATDSAVLGSTCRLSPSQTMVVTWAGVAPIFTKQPE